ncbi:Mur ligase domain-containing protein [Mucilaginibacter antarcticus]|uniref:Mur ligase domain-containing protein n=1 Tax=Mucilaginibacter antarcticus TaxID=1855725 RepID=UPI00363F3A84
MPTQPFLRLFAPQKHLTHEGTFYSDRRCRNAQPGHCTAQKGFEVTGSDDVVFEPSASRLAKHGILPAGNGWFPEKISTNLDAIILGMHARIDNPELLKAQELGIKVYSYPEYVYEQSKDKLRVVIGGVMAKPPSHQ